MIEGPLHLAIELSRVGDPFAFHFASQIYLAHSAGGGTENISFGWTTELLEDLASLRNYSPDPVIIQRVGDVLRDFLKPAGWARQEAVLTEAVRAGRLVVVTLRFAAAELYALPWELLTVGSSGQHLGELPRVLVRHEWPETTTAPEEPSPRPEGGRILVAWSAAGGTVPAAEHIHAVAQACTDIQIFDCNRDVLPHCSYGSLSDALEAAAAPGGHPIAVLHLLCHGGALAQTFGLVLDGEEGEGGIVVDAGRLRGLLGPHAGRLRLVVIAACDSGNAGLPGNHLGSVAQAVHRSGIATVVAARFPLSVGGSTRLTRAIYRELCGGPSSVEQAFLVARKELTRNVGYLDWAGLSLHTRGADGDDSRPLIFRPYRGLLAFHAEHRRFLFGREAEITEIVADLNSLASIGKPRFLVVAGASGTGKSSLVLAGAVPLLLNEPGSKLRSARLKPSRDPLVSLDRALVDPADPTRPLLLVVDQFEEIFTHCASVEDRQVFVRRLWSLASDKGSGVSVIVTLRVDFIGRCGELMLDDSGLRMDRIAYDEASRVFVPQMAVAALEEAIIRPAQLVGIALEPGLVRRLLGDLGTEPGALPLLEYTLDLLWQRREGRNLTQAAYDALGGIAGSLHRRADGLIDRLTEAEQKEVRRLLVRLVGVSGDGALDTRRREFLDELRPDDPATRDHFARVLDLLVDERLLVRDEEKGRPTIEVAHETLIRGWPRLRHWLDEDRDKLVALEILSDWSRAYHTFGTLLNAAQTAWAEETARRFGALPAAAASLLERSRTEIDRAAREREAQALRTRAALLLAAARLARKRGQSTDAALLLAEIDVQANMVGFAAEVMEVLRDWIAVAVFVGHRGPVQWVFFSQDGKHVITGSLDGAVAIWPPDDASRPRMLRGGNGRISSVDLSPDGQLVLVAMQDGSAHIWRTDGAPIRGGIRHDIDDVLRALFLPDGRIVTLGSAGYMSIWDRTCSASLVTVHLADQPLIDAAWVHGAERLAVTVSDGRVALINPDAAPATFVWVRPADDTRTCIVASPCEPLLALRGPQKEGILLDLRNGNVETSARIAASFHYYARFAPSGRMLVAERMAIPVVFELLNEGGPPRVVDGTGETDATVCAAFAPGERTIATGSKSGAIGLWRIPPASHTPQAMRDDKLRLCAVISDHQITVRAVAFSPSGDLLATASDDGTARVWPCSPPIDRLGERLEGHIGSVSSVVYMPSGMQIVTAGYDHTLRLWNAADTPVQATGVHDLGSSVHSVVVHPDSSHFVAATGDGLSLLPLDGGPRLALTASSPCVEVKCRPRAGLLVTLGSRTLVWTCLDPSGWSPDPQRWHARELDGVVSAAFSADGELLITGTDHGVLLVWSCQDTLSEQPLTVFGTDGGTIVHLDVDPKGRWLLICAEKLVPLLIPQNALRSVSRAPTMIPLPMHRNAKASAFSSDGRKLVVVPGGEVLAWDINEDGTLSPDPCVFNAPYAETIEFSQSDDQFLVNCGREVRVWRSDFRDAHFPLILPTDPDNPSDLILAACFSPDGEHVLTASQTGAVRRWPIGARELSETLRRVTSVKLSSEARLLYLGEG